MDPRDFTALPQCQPEALTAAAETQHEAVAVAGSICSRRVCGRVMFFELRGVEESARVQVMLQCFMCGEDLYQEARQQVKVGCSVTFVGTPGLSRRGDLSLVATNYAYLRQPDVVARHGGAHGSRSATAPLKATERACATKLPPCVILYQDEHIIAVDKPPHIPVHASFGRRRKRSRPAASTTPADTLLDRLAVQLGISARPKDSCDGRGLHPLHRLDRDTSGVVLFALDRASAAALRSDWRSTTKRYVTLVDGTVTRGAWLANAPLRRVQQASTRIRPKPVSGLSSQKDGQKGNGQIGAGVLACGPGFVSTTLALDNRVRDRAMVEQHLKLPEDGTCWSGNTRSLRLVDLHGGLVATEYTRVLYGDHGPYLEFTLEQLAVGRRICEWQSQAGLHSTSSGPGAFYATHHTSKGEGAKVYEQYRTVASKPNPPRTGTQWVWNDRPEGYADYRVGYYYISCFQVAVEEIGGDRRRQWRMGQRASAAASEQQHEHNALQPARTGFLRLAASNDSDSMPALSLLLATLHTGRTHQIRRHLAGAGTPVVGDGHYGKAKTNRRFKGVYGLSRMFLHSAYLRFQHPATRVWHTIESPLPPDLENFLVRLPSFSGGHWVTETSVGPEGWAEGVSSLSALAFQHMHRMPPADDGGDGGSGSEDEEDCAE